MNSWIRRLGFTHYDAYIIASTGHAASYVSPTGALLTGREKTSLSQRGNRAWKHIGEKIHNYCSHLKYSAQYATQSRWAHLSGPQRPMYPHPLVYTRGAPARRRLRLEKGQGRRRIGSYITKNNTSPSGCRVLRSGGLNHSRSGVLVCSPQCKISLTA